MLTTEDDEMSEVKMHLSSNFVSTNYSQNQNVPNVKNLKIRNTALCPTNLYKRMTTGLPIIQI